EAGKRGLQDELTPAYQRAGAHLAVMRAMTTDFREPWIWVVLAFVGRYIVEVVVAILMDQDLVKHDTAEVGVEYELATIFNRLGQPLPSPDAGRVKDKHNYVARVIVLILTGFVYGFWWAHDTLTEPNAHFQTNWQQEDALVSAVQSLRPT